MDIILDQIAIWMPSGAKKLNKRSVPAGSAYRTIDNPVYQKVIEPTFRYCKDYAVNKLAFCLFVRTKLDDAKLVEKKLDAVAKTITKEQALEAIANSTASTNSNFKYLPKLITEELA